MLSQNDWPSKKVLPTFRAADWGLTVSLCVAALSDHNTRISIVTDLKANLGPFASDYVGFKFANVYPGYQVLFAGDDVEQVPFILTRARTNLSSKKFGTPSDVSFAVQEAYQERLCAMIEDRVLKRYRYTSDSFQKYAKRQMRESLYNSVCSKIAEVRLSLQFLVAGFDASGKGHIIVVGNEEEPKDYTELGFFAIGSGSHAALSSLLFHKTHRRMLPILTQNTCVYFLCEAKYMAETTGIGKATTIILLSPPGSGLEMRFIAGDNRIREIWEKEGAPRVPIDIAKRIDRLVKRSTTRIMRRLSAGRSEDSQ